MENEADKSEEKRNYNDPKTGMFVVGNPGKPKGSRHMSTLLEEAIKKVAEDAGTTEDKAIVKKVIELARKGDMKAIEHIWDRLEGKAPQKIEVSNPEETERNAQEIKELTDKLNEIYGGKKDESKS